MPDDKTPLPRFDYSTDYGMAIMEPHPEGDYVRFEDHEASLTARKRQLSEAVELLGKLEDAVDEMLEVGDDTLAKLMTNKEAKRRLKAYATAFAALEDKLAWDQ